MDQPKPIRRSKELVPLSKEHHEGLLFGWKIKQGLANGTEKAIISRFIQWFWETDLQEHFRKEEQVLAPHLPQDNEWVRQMFSEHEEIEALIHVNAMIPDEDIMNQLAGSITNHIRFEERVLFPYAEGVIPASEMEEIHRQLIDVKQKQSWAEEFWMRKKG
jgi:iron-sulfur cluster repair protein YtfE (RIC family)